MLLIDEFLDPPSHPRPGRRHPIADRAGLRSYCHYHPLPVNLWHEAMGAPTTPDAALDRLLARLYRIELAGESMRRPERDKTADAGPSTADGAGQGR